MSTEDHPAPAKPFTQAGLLQIKCAAACGDTDRVPAIRDKADKRLKPVAPTPWICLACWRDGWRSDGPLGEGRWRIYHQDGRSHTLREIT